MAQGYSLKINKAVESDTGTYTCRICNSNHNYRKAIGASLFQDSYDHGANEDVNTLNSNAERNECDERSAFLKILGTKLMAIEYGKPTINLYFIIFT